MINRRSPAVKSLALPFIFQVLEHAVKSRAPVLAALQTADFNPTLTFNFFVNFGRMHSLLVEKLDDHSLLRAHDT
jgi:hypothetical protein